MIDLEKEREAFDKEFGVSEFNIFASNDKNISQSLVLKCNLVGWMRCAEAKQQVIDQLKARLAQVESGEMVLVPREPGDDITWKTLYPLFNCDCADGGGYAKERYIEIIEAVEKAMIEAAQGDGDE